MEPKLSIPKQLLRYLLDNGKGNTKKARRYLGLDYSRTNAINQAYFVFKQKGWAQPAGYGYYELTEEGRKQAAGVIALNPNEENLVVSAYEDDDLKSASKPEEQKEVSTFVDSWEKEAVGGELSTREWQEAYIRLSEMIVRKDTPSEA